jgi:hypothetical protein
MFGSATKRHGTFHGPLKKQFLAGRTRTDATLGSVIVVNKE